MKNSVLFGVICCALASMSWGAMFPVANGAFQHINPFYFTIIRYLPVTVILIFFLLKKEGKKAFRLEGNGIKIWFLGQWVLPFIIFLYFGVKICYPMMELYWLLYSKRLPLFYLYYLSGLYSKRNHSYLQSSV